jgi:hypothetical protein
MNSRLLLLCLNNLHGLFLDMDVPDRWLATFISLPFLPTQKKVSWKHFDIIYCCSVKRFFCQVLSDSESGCPQRNIFRVTEILLLDFEFFIGGLNSFQLSAFSLQL